MPAFKQVEQVRQHLSEITYKYWLHHNAFTLQWWLLICLAIVPWVVWFRLANKRRFLELMCYGFIIALESTFLDVIGTNLVLWGYPTHTFWFLIPSLFPIDYCVLPVEHMLIYQYFHKWSRFVLALIVTAVITAFMVEPLFVRIGIYRLYGWKYEYSFPIYVLKAVLARLLIQQFMRYQTSKSETQN